MVTKVLASFSILFIATAALSAKPKKKPRKANAQAKSELPAEKVSPKASENESKSATNKLPANEPPVVDMSTSNDEMEAYRLIQFRAIASVQDLADLMLMYSGEFAKFPTPEKRFNRAKTLGFIKGGYAANDQLPIGLLAHALHQKYDAEHGWLYWLTGWERYALRDAQEAGIIPQKAAPSQNLSGEQLFAIMTDAEEFALKRNEWQKGEK